MSLNRILVAAGAVAAATAISAAPAFAGNAHFIASQTSASASGTDLRVNFKEAGLESGSVETVQASAHLDATYQCVNKGNHNPDDPKKTTVNSDVSASGQFTAGKNGNLVGSLSLSAPAAATVLDCPSGQTSTLTVVTWSGVSIADLTSGAFLSIPGTFTAGTRIN